MNRIEPVRRAAPQPVSSGRQLAERLGVTRRTIERDLSALRRAGVPLYAEHGRTGGQVSLDRSGSAVLISHCDRTECRAAIVGRARSELQTADQMPCRRAEPSASRNTERPRRSRRTVEEASDDRSSSTSTTPMRGGQTTRGRSVGFYSVEKAGISSAGATSDRRGESASTGYGMPDDHPTGRQHDVDAVLGWVPGDVTKP